MARYILRRMTQMIPTVFGVIVITFVLFNIVGGSPASMTLGKNISPKSLEEFDEQRGFNKPLFFGRWTRTRAYEDTAFRLNAGLWRTASAVRHVPPSASGPGSIQLPGMTNYPVPLAFGLKEETDYEWILSYRLATGTASMRLREIRNPEAVADGLKEGRDGNPGFRTLIDLPVTVDWKTVRVPFRNAMKTAPGDLDFSVDAGMLEVASLKLRRKMPHLWDSQFVFYLRQLVRLDFGVSSFTNQRVSLMLADGVWPSLSLTVPIFLVEVAVAISIALICAFFRNSWLDRSIVVVAVILMSVNYLVWIIFGQYVLGYKAGLFPIWGYESWRFLLLPVVIGVVSGLGDHVRFYRTIMLDEMYKDYVRTAFAKGVSAAGVLFRHVLKNAMIPILTNVIIAIPFLYTGSLLLEGFFGIPGLGNMSINAINYSDVDVVRAIVFIGAVLYVFANLMTDICYALVDPRVKLE